MAGGLKFTGSVIAVLQITGDVISLDYGYIGGKKAANGARNLIDELHSLSKVLVALQDYAHANLQPLALQKLNNQDGLLQGCRQELERFQLELGQGILGNFKWPLKENGTM